MERCWELDSLNEEYAAFIRALRLRMVKARTKDLEPTAAFTQRIRLVHEYRRFPYRDPGLPPDLQPPGWLGDEGRELFVEAHKTLARGAEEYFAGIGLIAS